VKLCVPKFLNIKKLRTLTKPHKIKDIKSAKGRDLCLLKSLRSLRLLCGFAVKIRREKQEK
jgi:hypothetical protein